MGWIKTRYKCIASGNSTSSVQGIVGFGATAAGSVWLIDNVSVKRLPGNHATQATVTARPTYLIDVDLPCLSFDGVDDFLVAPGTASALASLHGGTGAIVSIAYSTPLDAKYHTLLTTSNLGTATSIGATLSQDNRDSSKRLASLIGNGSGTLHVLQNPIVQSAPSARVVTVQHGTGLHVIRHNGTVVSASAPETGAPSSAASSYDLWICKGQVAGFLGQAKLYGLIIRGALSSPADILAAEKLMRQKSRAY